MTHGLGGRGKKKKNGNGQHARLSFSAPQSSRSARTACTRALILIPPQLRFQAAAECRAHTLIITLRLGLYRTGSLQPAAARPSSGRLQRLQRRMRTAGCSSIESPEQRAARLATLSCTRLCLGQSAHSYARHKGANESREHLWQGPFEARGQVERYEI